LLRREDQLSLLGDQKDAFERKVLEIINKEGPSILREQLFHERNKMQLPEDFKAALLNKLTGTNEQNRSLAISILLNEENPRNTANDLWV
jgi:hypothetical protein